MEPMHFLTTLIEGVFRLEFFPTWGLLSLIYWIYQLGKWILDFFSWLFGWSGNTFWNKREELTVSKTKFVKEVVQWCGENLGLPPKKFNLPNVTISRSKQDSWLGLYDVSNREIVIYWKGKRRLKSVINTTIHEYQHFLDLRKGKHSFYYEKELAEVGYHDNLYERRARKTASLWEDRCYKAMVQKGIIRK